MTQDVIDLTNLKADSNPSEFDIIDGILCRGKIESYGNAGQMDDPKTGKPQKMVMMQITVPIPASDVPRFQAMENADCMIELLIQPLTRRPTAKDDPPEDML